MGQQIPNGAQLQIASVIAAALTVTAATNAAAAVLTVTNTYAVGDYVEFTSGWSRATNRVYRLSAASGTSITLEGLDTTSTTLFPAGSGVGTVRKITTWTQILQVMNLARSGGDIQTGNFQYLENTFETEFSTVVSAQAWTFDLADDITLPGYIAYKAASDLKAQTPMRMILPSGGILAVTGTPFVNDMPTTEQNNLMMVSARFSFAGRVTRY